VTSADRSGGGNDNTSRLLQQPIEAFVARSEVPVKEMLLDRS
jgi:hypothetical protein